MSLRNALIANPLSVYVLRTFQALRTEWQYRHQHLSIGRGSSVRHSSFGYSVTIYNDVVLEHVRLGDFTYVANGSLLAHVTCGKFCSIGPGVKIGLGIHPTEFVSTHPIFYSRRRQAQASWSTEPTFTETAETTIGHDVWIGANAVLRDGIAVGHGAIIGAGAVVTKDVAPYAIVGGVPAKLIRYRFAPESIAALLNSAWWDRDRSWLQQNYRAFQHVEEFLRLVNS